MGDGDGRRERKRKRERERERDCSLVTDKETEGGDEEYREREAGGCCGGWEGVGGEEKTARKRTGEYMGKRERE